MSHRQAAQLAIGAVWAAALAIVATSAPVGLAQPAGSATAAVQDVNGGLIGTATFTPVDGGVQINARFQGLTPGQHGIHVHTNGACDPPDFMSAGGHFNPTNKQHGLENPQGAHVGDLPNLDVGANGSATFSGLLMESTFDASPTSLLKPGGTSLVIHADPDDEVTDPAGNSGARIACGLIVASAQAAAPAELPRRLPTTGGAADVQSLLGGLGAVLVASGVWLRRRHRR
jgi:Cu-Zn family superoxide dismutase